MDQLHLITVHESSEKRIHASSAELTVRISGQSLFSGDEAFKKAAEVSRCVEGLKKCGIESEDISITNVSLDVDSGILSKSSSATYSLLVQCQSLDQLGPALSTISSQKNASVYSLIWKFKNVEETRQQLLQSAVKKAKSTADSIAASLGTQCLSVHELTYVVHGANQQGTLGDMTPFQAASRSRASATVALQQLSFEYTTNLNVSVTAKFAVASFQTNEQ